MSERKNLFNLKASLAEQIEFYQHEYQTAKTCDMACRAVAGLEQQEGQQ